MGNHYNWFCIIKWWSNVCFYFYFPFSIAADEISQWLGLAPKLGLTKAQIDSVVAVHPTASEGNLQEIERERERDREREKKKL